MQKWLNQYYAGDQSQRLGQALCNKFDIENEELYYAESGVDALRIFYGLGGHTWQF